MWRFKWSNNIANTVLYRNIVIKKIKKIFNYIVLIEIKEVVYYLEIKNKLIVNSLIKNKEDFTNDFKFNEIKKKFH